MRLEEPAPELVTPIGGMVRDGGGDGPAGVAAGSSVLVLSEDRSQRLSAGRPAERPVSRTCVVVTIVPWAAWVWAVIACRSRTTFNGSRIVCRNRIGMNEPSSP